MQKPTNAKPGDRVEVHFTHLIYEGILLQTSDDEKENVLLKLDNGYNIGFKKKDVDEIKILKERAEEAFNYRKQTQPMGEKTSGCFFKNVDGKSAGQMIDQAGLKNFSVGNFYVSPIHANFIINRGNGQAKDLVELVRIIKEKVKEKFGVELEEEIIYV